MRTDQREALARLSNSFARALWVPAWSQWHGRNLRTASPHRHAGCAPVL